MPIGERRKYPRSEADLLVLFPGGRGRTLDISAGGLRLETENVDGLVGRALVPLEIHLERNPPFVPAIVMGDGSVIRMHRRPSEEYREREEGPVEAAPRWEVALMFQSPMEVSDFQ